MFALFFLGDASISATLKTLIVVRMLPGFLAHHFEEPTAGHERSRQRAVYPPSTTSA
jgi:hypothetical protein